MKQKRALSIFVIISLLFGMTSISFADPTEDLHTGEIPASLTGGVKGPKVEEYYHYKEDLELRVFRCLQGSGPA